MKIVVIYWTKHEFGGLEPGFDKAFSFTPLDERFFEFTREDWEDWLVEQYEKGRIKTDEHLSKLRFYVYAVSGKPKFYKCLFPGYDKSGKVLGVEKHGGV